MKFPMKRIHFVGIGGIGMSGIAEILLNNGYQISGSDIKSTTITTKLSKLGAKIHIGHASGLVVDAGVVVINSAINKHNIEILEAMNLKIPIIHRTEMLAELMRLKYGITVCGTHGKTTTTSMLATVLHGIDFDPTVVIGGRVNNFDSNAKNGKSDYFIAEACESDGSFLRLSPIIAIVTNVDKDHLDYYSGLEAIIEAFKSFLDKVPFYGAICACIDDPGVQLAIQHLQKKIITYGFRPDADITVRNIQKNGLQTSFIPVVLGKEYAEVNLKMFGKHNITNALASYAVALFLGIDCNLVSKHLSNFTGVLHRSTLVAEINNTMIIDDYAHNPTKISTELKELREAYPEKQIIVIFQPHRYTRIKYQEDEFAKSFLYADKVIVTPIYSASEQAIPGITSDHLSQQIKNKSFNNALDSVYISESLEQATTLAVFLIKNNDNKEGNIIITLGAGDIASVGQNIAKLLAI